MEKFAVVSLDYVKDNVYWDFVVADSKEDAEMAVCHARPYVNGAEAINGRQLDAMSERLYKTSAAKIEWDFRNETLTLHECQNCGLHWREEDLKPVEDIHERVAPGEPMPSGECPECGAVCHEIEKPKGVK